MKLFAFLVALAFFVGSFVLFGYAFTVVDPYNTVLFVAGLLSIAIALMIPFHLLERLD